MYILHTDCMESRWESIALLIGKGARGRKFVVINESRPPEVCIVSVKTDFITLYSCFVLLSYGVGNLAQNGYLPQCTFPLRCLEL